MVIDLKQQTEFTLVCKMITLLQSDKDMFPSERIIIKEI